MLALLRLLRTGSDETLIWTLDELRLGAEEGPESFLSLPPQALKLKINPSPTA